VERPKNKKTAKPIEPAHKFEVSLEADSFTKEKYEDLVITPLRAC
jgi:hypothetical protein